MADAGPEPDPWQVVVDLVAESSAGDSVEPELARRLQELSARFGDRDTTTEQLLADLERSGDIDVDAPVESSRPVVPAMKRAVRKANAFMFRHLAQQVSAATGALTLVSRRLDERLRRIEAAADPAAARGWSPDHLHLFEAELERVRRAGPVRVVTSWDAARILPAADAGAVVLHGLTDVAAAADQVRLLDRVLKGLRPGGVIITIATHPARWSDVDPRASDLAPGRPLHPETWVHLLGERGVADPTVVEREPAYLVAGRLRG